MVGAWWVAARYLSTRWGVVKNEPLRVFYRAATGDQESGINNMLLAYRYTVLLYCCSGVVGGGLQSHTLGPTVFNDICFN